MKRFNSFIESIQTGKGLLLFLVGVMIVWVGGYFLIDVITSDEWKRFSRQLFFSRATLIIALFFLIAASIPHFRKFVLETDRTAADLAIFRILFFGFFAVGFALNPSIIADQVQPFLDLPESAQVSLPFMGWYPKVIPINETLVRIASILFFVSTFTSLFGFKTKWSILLFTLTLFYLFAIPNLYGKVNHNHHLIWFPAILAFSPCADRFSVDAYFRKRSEKAMRHSSKAYTLPFLLIWLLIGLIYFFPGFWKIWTNGLDWALTDNVRNQMYYKWFALGDKNSWLPFIRIDQYPILFKASGMYTLIFELAFIPLVLNKATRKVAIVLGIGFHIGTYVFMHIFFVLLVWSYLSFVKWSDFSFFREKTKEVEHTGADAKLVKWIGATLLVSCIVFGFGKWNSWPFTVYPTFDSMVQEETKHLMYIGETRKGQQIEMTNAPLYLEYTSPRYWEMEYDVIEKQANDHVDSVLLDHFISVYANTSKELAKVSVYLETQSIIPEMRREQPRTLIYSKEVN